MVTARCTFLSRRRSDPSRVVRVPIDARPGRGKAARRPGAPADRGAGTALWQIGCSGDTRLFELGPLWFLWYLLVFVTIAPFASRVLGWLFLRPTPEVADRIGQCALRRGLAPLILGVASVPGLLAAAEPSGWTLGRAAGIPATFPDFLFQYQPDMPFYLGYFLAGWWLYRLREGLPEVARLWLPTLVLGTIADVAAAFLSESYADRTGTAASALIRIGGFSLYAIGGAYTSFGFVGFFQQYVNRPTRLGRYLADTAFWVYLAHQELLQGPLGAWLSACGFPGGPARCSRPCWQPAWRWSSSS